MKKRVLIFLLVVLMILPLASCGNADDGTIRVATLNGTTGFGMAKLMNDNKDNEKMKFAVQSDASLVTAALISGDADIAALPTNAAANLYQITDGDIVVLAVNTLGCLYLVTTGQTEITSLVDLKGKTLYTPAQNPAFIVEYLCRKSGLNVGKDITIDSTSYAQAANLRDAVAAGRVEFAVLPEPMVTMAQNSGKSAGVTVRNVLDLNSVWNGITGKESLVQGCLVARKEFAENNPEAVNKFLEEYRASVDFVNENHTVAAEEIVSAGIFANAKIAEKAIPACNIRYIDGAEMITAMKQYLEILYAVAPASIGGKLPDDGLFYNAK